MEKEFKKAIDKLEECVDILIAAGTKMDERAREDMQDEMLDTYEQLIEEHGGEIAFYDNDPSIHVFYDGTEQEEEIIITAVKEDRFRYRFEADAGIDKSSVTMMFDKEKAVFAKTYFDEYGLEDDWDDFTLYNISLKEALDYLLLYSSSVLEEYVDNFLEDRLSIHNQITQLRPYTYVKGC